MNIFGLSPGELLLILMVAMIVLGPEKLPEVAASLGKWIREFRRATEELTAQFAGDNPLLELQRALSLVDEPVAAPAVEPEPSPVDAEPEYVPAQLPSPAVPATNGNGSHAPAPVRSDYFLYPPSSPGIADDWTHGSLLDEPWGGRRLASRISAREFQPIPDDWFHGVPVGRPPVAMAEDVVANGHDDAFDGPSTAPMDGPAEIVTSESASESTSDGLMESLTSDTNGASELVAAQPEESTRDVVVDSSPTVRDADGDSTADDEADGSKETRLGDTVEVSPVLDVVNVRDVSVEASANGVSPRQSDVADAVSVPASATDSREGDRT